MAENFQKKLVARCKKADIEAEIKPHPFDDDPYVVVSFPNGREKRQISFFNDEKIKALLRTDFENHVFLGDLIAIANYEEGTIESLIRTLDGRSRRYLNRGLFGELEEDEAFEPIILKNEAVHDSLSIEIGEASDIIKLIARGPYKGSDVLSLKLTGIKVKQHSKCLGLLKKISNSLFFQLDIQKNIAITLVKDRRPLRRIGRRNKDDGIELEFPKIELDEGPISLYWYARSALGMPLLQFLAFYQVIEYYFPAYSQEEARRRVRVILKDPSFRVDRDSDIGKVITSLSGQGRGFGDERSQLRATINACLSPQEIRNFLTDDEERIEFFSSKQKRLTDHKVPIANKEADLRNSVADLVYDIRCKIVHTKGETNENEVDLLLPFSKEAELLYYDIELLHFIAKKVLIAASAPISL